jgi:hypothetical protein
MASFPGENCSVEDLISLTEKFSCADNRLELPPLVNINHSSDLSLIGKLISPRNFSNLVVRDITQRAWNLRHPSIISRVDNNLFLFSFECLEDLELVFSKRPWTLRGAHLILKRCIPDLHWHEMDFSKSTFWIQIHGLPAFWQEDGYLNHIGSLLGSVIHLEPTKKNRPTWKKFNRIRVDIDISKPLKPGFFLPRKDRDDLWIGIKFEKLPETCFSCGIIGHVAKDCNFATTMLSNQFGFKLQAFGDWLSSNNDGSPPGIYDRVHHPPLASTPVLTAVVNSMEIGRVDAPIVPAPESPLKDSVGPHILGTCPQSIGVLTPGLTPITHKEADKTTNSYNGRCSGVAAVCAMDVASVSGKTYSTKPAITIKLSRFELLKVRPLVKCKHSNFVACPVVETISYKFGMDPEGPNTEFCLPFQPKDSTPSPHIPQKVESILVDIPITQAHVPCPLTPKTNPGHIITPPNNPSHFSSVNLDHPPLSLKRKSPSPTSTPKPKKSKNPIQTSCSNPKINHESCSMDDATQISFPIQNFSMAEEAGLIMPPPSP